MRAFLLSTLAALVVVPPNGDSTSWLERLVGGPLPLWSKALTYIVGALGSSTVVTLLWLRLVRPALDTFIVESFQRRSLDHERHMRTAIFADDFVRASRRDQMTSEALDLGRRAMSRVDAQDQMLETVASQHSQSISAIGVVAELVKNVAEDVGALRRELAERTLHGAYDRRA